MKVSILMSITLMLVLFTVWALRNWDEFCDTVELFPSNVKRLAEWHKRRVLRLWNKALNLLGGVK